MNNNTRGYYNFTIAHEQNRLRITQCYYKIGTLTCMFDCLLQIAPTRWLWFSITYHTSRLLCIYTSYTTSTLTWHSWTYYTDSWYTHFITYHFKRYHITHDHLIPMSNLNCQSELPWVKPYMLDYPFGCTKQISIHRNRVVCDLPNK